MSYTFKLPLDPDKTLFDFLKERRDEKGRLYTAISGEWWGGHTIDREYVIQLRGDTYGRAHLVSDETLEKVAEYFESCMKKLGRKNKTFKITYKALESQKEVSIG